MSSQGLKRRLDRLLSAPATEIVFDEAERLALEGAVLLPGAAEAVERTLRTGTGALRCTACILLQVHLEDSPSHELIRLSDAGILRRAVQLLQPTNSLEVRCLALPVIAAFCLADQLVTSWQLWTLGATKEVCSQLMSETVFPTPGFATVWHNNCMGLLLNQLAAAYNPASTVLAAGGSSVSGASGEQQQQWSAGKDPKKLIAKHLVRSGAVHQVAQLLHGYRLEAEQQGWGTAAASGMRANLEEASYTAVGLLANVCGSGLSGKPARALVQEPHLLGDLAFFARAHEGSTGVRDTAAYSLMLARNLVKSGVLCPAELCASGLARAAVDAASCTSWQAADLQLATQPDTILAGTTQALQDRFPPYSAVMLFAVVAGTESYRTTACWHFPPSPEDHTAAVDGIGTGSRDGDGGGEFSAALVVMAELATGARAMDDPLQHVEVAPLAAQYLLEMAEPLGILPRADVVARVVRPVVARAAREVREARQPLDGAFAWADAQHQRLLASPQGAGSTRLPAGLLTVRYLLRCFMPDVDADAGPDNDWVQVITDELWREDVELLAMTCNRINDGIGKF